MLSDTQKQTIFRGIPEDFEYAGLFITASKRYANQYMADIHPAIVLQYIAQNNPANEILDDKYDETKVRKDRIRYKSGTLTYELSIGHVTSITEVTGTKSGVAHTFVPADYTLVDEDKITFTGVSLPDNNTDVLVTFISEWMFGRKGTLMADTLQISVFACDIKNEQTGKTINGIKIVDYLAQQIYNHFKYEFEKDDISVSAISSISDNDEIAEHSAIRGRVFTVTLLYWDLFTMTPVETIEEVEHTMDVEL